MARRTIGRVALAVAAVLAGAGVRAEEAVTMDERFTEGHQYRVRLRVELSGTLNVPASKGKPAKAVKLEGTSSIDYAERVVAVEKGQVSKSLRLCEKLDFRRTLAGQEQSLSLRPSVRRLVILRKGHTEVPFSPDGPLMWGEIDAVRTDVFVPALVGLLPGKAVEVGSRWPVSEKAVQELTDLEKIEEGILECRLERVAAAGRRRLAKVSFTGTVRGISEDGPARHRIQGSYNFDLDNGYLADVTLLGTASLLDRDGKEAGRIEGRFVLSREKGGVRELSDEAAAGVKVEPNADNTQLLYDNPEMGVRFLHSRRWRIAQVMGSQVALAAADGSGLLITLDPVERVPSAAAYQEEARGWLVKQKGKLLRTYTPRRLRDRPALDGFAFEAEMGGQKVWLDYYVAAQANGGATVAARLLPDELKELRREVDRIAKSVTVTKRIVERKK